VSTNEVEEQRKVHASPEKRFFIEMLVKDIELVPAIVDLVDNSVDSAREISAEGDFTGLKVEIETSSERFSITDNCAGMSTEIARHYAFHFGRPKGFTGAAESVGQFGVGLKRALFKLGRGFSIESRTASTYFLIEEDVRVWAANTNEGTDWSFKFKDFNDAAPIKQGQSTGTTITVEPLLPSVSEDFDNDDTLSRLRLDLELRHQEALRKGFEIKLNGTPLKPRQPRLLTSTEFAPIRRRFDVDAPEPFDDLAIEEEVPLGDPEPGDALLNGHVEVELFAGIVRGELSESEDAEPEDILRDSDAGWYVFCNDRLLLVADQTALTGWGSGAAAYHPQYSRFRGYVYISGKSSLLPWNTTKTSVDRDSEVWRTVRFQMVRSLRETLRILNRIKAERQTQSEDERVLTLAANAAKESPLAELAESPALIHPELPKLEPNVKGISYSVDIARFEAARETLEATSASDVGRRTFDWYYERQVQD
jgi:hypothetical protein